MKTIADTFTMTFTFQQLLGSDEIALKLQFFPLKSLNFGNKNIFSKNNTILDRFYDKFRTIGESEMKRLSVRFCLSFNC